MACESRRKAGQSLTARIDEVKRAMARLEQALSAGRAKVVIGPNGAVAFQGWTD